MKKLLVISMLLSSFTSVADTTEELPNPLPIDYLFSVTKNHPSLSLAESQKQASAAQKSIANANAPLTLNFEGRLGWREFAQEEVENHRAVLHLNKTLYDFNRSSSALDQATAMDEAKAIELKTHQQKHQIRLLEGFFNVILADYQYRVDNEAMAIEYVGFDKIKDKLDLNRISDVDYLKAEVAYQKSLTRRSLAEQGQRQSRLELALLLGDAQKMADEIAMPKLLTPKLSEIESYIQQAETNNPKLKSLQKEHESALAAIANAEASDNAKLTLDAYGGRLDSFPEKREGNWRVDLNLVVPLYDGNQANSKKQLAQAKASQIAAQIAQQKQQIHRQITQLYFVIKAAQIEAKQNQAFGDYADLYLDYSRGMYENELKTDFGDAMVRLSESNLQSLKTQFKQTLAWAKLNLLIGNDITPQLIIKDVK